jgi:hypothetical protein
MEIPNLWSDFIFKQDENTPFKIITKQAEYLTENTKGILKGRLKIVLPIVENIRYCFGIEAPHLGKYTYQLFLFSHNPKELYPLEIEEDTRGRLIINSEEELISTLKEIFASPNTQKVIQTLISQSDVFI